MQSTESMEQEMINDNPRKYIIAGLLIIAAFFGGLGAWAAFFPFSGAVIAPGMVDVIPGHVNLGPQMVGDRAMLAKLDAPTGGGVPNAHTPDSDNSVVRDAKVMDYRGVKALYMDMDSSASFPGHLSIDIVYVAIVDVYVFVCSLRSFCQDINAE